MAAVLVVLVLVAVLHGRSGAYGYSYWDDHTLVRDNPRLEEPSAANILAILTPEPQQGEALYIPVAYLAWLFERALFGDASETLHVVNLALHALNGFLVFLLLLGLAGRPGAALLGAVCFVAHPLQVESVAWIMGGRDLLAASFALLSLLAHLRYLGATRRRWLLLALLCYVLAVFTKPVAAPLPALMLLLDYRHTGSWRRCHWMAKVPFLLVAVLAVVLNAMTADPAVAALVDLPHRLLCVPWLLWHWTVRLLLPTAPVPFHAWPPAEARVELALVGFASLAAVLALGVLAWRRRRHVVWQVLLACGLAFAPAVLVVLEGKRAFLTGDRYAYLPLVAVSALASAVLLAPAGRARRLGACALGVWLLACGVTSYRAVGTWEDGTALWSRVLEVHPDEPEALVNRGSAHARAGRLEEAWHDYARALEARPRDRLLLGNVARLHLDRKRPAEALPYLERYLAVGPEDVETYIGLGYAASRAGRHADALRWYAEAERLAPRDQRVALGRRRAVAEHLRRRLAADPEDVGALMASARLADEAGDPDRALGLLRRAAALDSSQQADALYHLGRLLLQQGEREEGRAQLRAALEVDPTHVGARRLLGR